MNFIALIPFNLLIMLFYASLNVTKEFILFLYLCDYIWMKLLIEYNCYQTKVVMPNIYFNLILYFKGFYIALILSFIFSIFCALLNVTQKKLSNLHVYNCMFIPKICFNFIAYFNGFYITMLYIKHHIYFLTHLIFYRG